MKFNRYILAISLPVLLVSIPSRAYAQLRNAPVSPGQTLQDLQLKTVPSDIQPNIQPKKKPKSIIEDKTPEQSKPVPATGSEKRVLIRHIDLEGVTLIDTRRMQALVSSYENKEDSFQDLQALAEKLTQQYRDAGYVTSRVYIPPQKLENASLKLQALEGHIGRIEIEDGKYFKASTIKYNLALKPGQPFNINDLKHSLRILNENPDRNIMTLLKPGEKTGDTDIVLQISDKRSYHLTPSYDNLGRRTIGNDRYGLQFENTNMFGLADDLLTSVSFTDNSFGLVEHYQVPLGGHGTKFAFDYAYSHLHPQKEFKPLDLEGEATTYTPSIIQDIVNKENYKLYASVAFDFKQLDTHSEGLPLNHDLLRVLRPGVTYEEYDNWGRTFFRNEFDWGLPIFGGTSGTPEGSITPSRLGAGTKFFAYTSSMIRTQKMPWSTYAIFRVIGQLSPDRLVSSNQFQAGGAFTVRGYKEGQEIGDQGLLLSGEWRLPFFFVPKSWVLPGTHYNFWNNLQIVPFLDYGTTVVNDPAPGVAKSENLLGTGVGLRAQLTKYLNVRLDLGFPLIHVPQNTNPRIHFGIQNTLF